MKLFKQLGFFYLFLFFVMNAFGQKTSSNADENNFMTADGKIFVVMAVVVVIVLGLLIYLINLDRKITRLEKNNKG